MGLKGSAKMPVCFMIMPYGRKPTQAEPQDCWKPAIQLDEKQAIMVREPDAAMQPTPQGNQLMSKHRVLSFKP
jgi:hypothetical protein